MATMICNCSMMTMNKQPSQADIASNKPFTEKVRDDFDHCGMLIAYSI